jgi:hypothetical protein
MEQLWNDIISTSIGGAAGGAVAGLVLYWVQHLHQGFKDSSETRRILKWMQAELDVGFNTRSTKMIASFTNLPVDRVRHLCSHSSKIHMYPGAEDDIWTVNYKLAKRTNTLPD